MPSIVTAPGIFSRGIWHDEAISLIQTGQPSPVWPDEPAPARVGGPGASRVPRDGRRGRNQCTSFQYSL